jgi:hypothetical protein
MRGVRRLEIGPRGGLCRVRDWAYSMVCGSSRLLYVLVWVLDYKSDPGEGWGVVRGFVKRGFRISVVATS